MRVKRGVTAKAKHNKTRKATKGMSLSNRSSVRRGKQAIVKAMENAHRDRREKKRTFRQLWNARINAAARINGTTYSLLMSGIKKNNISVNRKILSEIAVNDADAFAMLVKEAQKK
jgi:large subunit ribosomal protein L20